MPGSVGGLPRAGQQGHVLMANPAERLVNVNRAAWDDGRYSAQFGRKTGPCSGPPPASCGNNGAGKAPLLTLERHTSFQTARDAVTCWGASCLRNPGR